MRPYVSVRLLVGDRPNRLSFPLAGFAELQRPWPRQLRCPEAIRESAGDDLLLFAAEGLLHDADFRERRRFRALDRDEHLLVRLHRAPLAGPEAVERDLRITGRVDGEDDDGVGVER